MSTLITGHDPNVSTWPVESALVSGGVGMAPVPGYVIGGTGTYPTILAHDNDESSYLNERAATTWFRCALAPFTLPAGARITMAQAQMRGRLHVSNTKFVNARILLGDHSDPSGKASDISASTGSYSLQPTIFHDYASASIVVNSLGQPITQVDINKGLYVLFGLNPSYGVNSGLGADFSQVWGKFQYDMPPTLNLTYPVDGQTISTSSAPTVTWDYADDFQAQAKYQVRITDNIGNLIYDSGIVVSSDTFHALTSNLDDGVYTATVKVAQMWNGQGGDFWTIAPDSVTFVMNTLNLGTPRISVAPNNEHAEITVYPDVNLLSFDGSTFDNGVYTCLTYSNCTIAPDAIHVRDGNGSCKMTVTSIASAPYIQTQIGLHPCGPGDTYKAMAYFNPLALSGKQANVSIVFYDGSYNVLSTVSGSWTTLATNAWTQATLAGAIAPSNAAYYALKMSLNNVIVSDIIYVDDSGIWWQLDTAVLPPWNRGGFFESTDNLLSYSDSTVDDGNSTWNPDPNFSLTTMGLSSSYSYHGSSSLQLKKLSGATATIQAILGNGQMVLNALPGQSLTVFCAVYATAIRTVAFGINWYKIDNTASGTPSTFVTATSINGGNQVINGNFQTPSDAAYGVPFFNAQGVTTTTEAFYFDAFSIYPTSNYPLTMGFIHGYYPDTDTAPTVLVEYTMDGATWKTLGSTLVYPSAGSYLFFDYSIPSGTTGLTRTYRASLYEIENGVQLNSSYSDTSFTQVILSNVWMHSDSDPAGTVYQYQWDGYGRTLESDALGQQVQVEGQTYPFTQFGIQSEGTVAVALHLETNDDVSALEDLALTKSTIVFRDQRGRSVRGVLGKVQFTDFVAGIGADVSFTINYSGDQP